MNKVVFRTMLQDLVSKGMDVGDAYEFLCVTPTSVPVSTTSPSHTRRNTIRDICYRTINDAGGQCLTKDQVYAIVIQSREDCSLATVQTTLSKLAKEQLIENVWGRGYRISLI